MRSKFVRVKKSKWENAAAGVVKSNYSQCERILMIFKFIVEKEQIGGKKRVKMIFFGFGRRKKKNKRRNKAQRTKMASKCSEVRADKKKEEEKVDANDEE